MMNFTKKQYYKIDNFSKTSKIEQLIFLVLLVGTLKSILGGFLSRAPSSFIFVYLILNISLLVVKQRMNLIIVIFGTFEQ